jgi:hypothetical protein
MFRQAASLALLIVFLTGAIAHADDGSAQQQRSFKPVWTVVGAGAGFGLGVWAGLTKFDDAINSDRKVWTTAIVSAAAGGVLGFLIDRHRARRPKPTATPPTAAAPSESWRQSVYGSPTAPATLTLPPVKAIVGLQSSWPDL